jgi:hypothetical protein
MDSGQRTISIMLLVFIASALLMVFLAAQSFISAYDFYYQGKLEQAVYYLIYGTVGLALAGYTLLQLRKRTKMPEMKEPEMVTVTECQKCGLKNLRKFVKGDYVMKDSDDCPKCKKPTLITAIYEKPEPKKK